MTEVRIVDNTDTLKKEFDKAILRSLEKCGLVCEGYAAAICPVDTGRLRASITHDVGEDNVKIGTNVEYSAYVELGTSRQKPQPYLRPALSEHREEYALLIKREFEKI